MSPDKIIYRDFPFDQVVRKANKIAAHGGRAHQKFTCSGCGARLTIEQPNVFHEFGTCDRCGYVTNIKRRGCGYLVYVGATP